MRKSYQVKSKQAVMHQTQEHESWGRGAAAAQALPEAGLCESPFAASLEAGNRNELTPRALRGSQVPCKPQPNLSLWAQDHL